VRLGSTPYNSTLVENSRLLLSPIPLLGGMANHQFSLIVLGPRRKVRQGRAGGFRVCVKTHFLEAMTTMYCGG
jgi:hypothetical protein